MKALHRTFTAALLAPAFALAHEGHGQAAASHWHASDVFGYVVLAVALGLVWYARRK